jgi:hypothetical protein
MRCSEGLPYFCFSIMTGCKETGAANSGVAISLRVLFFAHLTASHLTFPILLGDGSGTPLRLNVVWRC